MLSIGYNNRWIRLVKDLLFVGLGVWLVCLKRFLPGAFGVLAIWWYGRDAWFQIKALWQEKHYKAPGNKAPQAAPKDDKITVTNPSGIKEVDFKKDA